MVKISGFSQIEKIVRQAQIPDNFLFQLLSNFFPHHHIVGKVKIWEFIFK